MVVQFPVILTIASMVTAGSAVCLAFSIETVIIDVFINSVGIWRVSFLGYGCIVSFIVIVVGILVFSFVSFSVAAVAVVDFSIVSVAFDPVFVVSVVFVTIVTAFAVPVSVLYVR